MTFVANSQSVTEADAIAVGKNWLLAIDNSQTYSDPIVISNTTLEIGETPTFYIVNFKSGAFVIVPTTKLVKPILSYSTKSTMNTGEITYAIDDFLNSYNDAINIHIATNTPMDASIAEEWYQLMNGTYSCSGGSSMYPSLLNHYNTSRWAGWSPHLECLDELNAIQGANSWDKNRNNCVPIAMAQLMRFYRHPFSGSGSHSYSISGGYASGQTISSNFDDRTYDYDLMPYQTQNHGPADGFPADGVDANGAPYWLDAEAWMQFYPYCFENANNINEAPENSEIGKLVLDAGISVGMSWFGVGTGGSPATWGNEMVNHFNYSFSSSDYVVSTNGMTAFKNALRASLDAEHPALAAGYGPGTGHAFIIDGYECGDYFHCNTGHGGGAFYYFFTADANGNYQLTAYTHQIRCALNITPNCNLPYDLSLPSTTYVNGDAEAEQVNNILSTGAGSTVLIQPGADIFFIGGQRVEILGELEVELGGELYINVENCEGPN